MKKRTAKEFRAIEKAQPVIIDSGDAGYFDTSCVSRECAEGKSMTVGDLIAFLSKLDPNSPIVLENCQCGFATKYMPVTRENFNLN